ncbi:SCO6880 family protein [Micromonospora sp. ALFpr18c]|uniref:SCO6880 family protein n=1 Tax=Micromonospora sp. ALFpr18c TaxID=1458665 RepID=UPI001CEC2584|nr:SCO6880 family protein [Micromonospora sp. ALFpr18c]
MRTTRKPVSPVSSRATVSPPAALITAITGLLVLAPLAIRINGRTGFQVITARVAWWLARSRRHHVYISGVASRVTAAHQLPGVLARSEVYEVETGRSGLVAVVVVPQSRHYTVTLRCAPEGMDLVDQAVIDARVGHLASWLAALSREPQLVQAQVTIETTPDPGTRLATEVAATSRPDAPALALQVLNEVVESYPAGSATVDTRVSLTYTAPPGRSMSHEDVCREVAARLPHLHAGLTGATGDGIIPMSARGLASVVRAAYDPAAALDLARDTQHTPDWPQAGPVATRESWDSYRHDSGISRTWCLVEAPRGVVYSRLFSRLTDPDPQLLRKRVTMIYRPYSPGEAARLVESDKRDARFLAAKKHRPSARDLTDLAAAEQAAEEEATGAGVVRFTVLVTATVADETQLDEATGVIRARAGEARLALRPMYGCQAAGFAAGLPAGVVLPTHATIPF